MCVSLPTKLVSFTKTNDRRGYHRMACQSAALSLSVGLSINQLLFLFCFFSFFFLLLGVASSFFVLFSILFPFDSGDHLHFLRHKFNRNCSRVCLCVCKTFDCFQNWSRIPLTIHLMRFEKQLSVVVVAATEMHRCARIFSHTNAECCIVAALHFIIRKIKHQLQLTQNNEVSNTGVCTHKTTFTLPVVGMLCLRNGLALHSENCMCNTLVGRMLFC